VRNAETSVGPPTDPFEPAPSSAAKHPVRPVSSGLPPGVSPDIGLPPGVSPDLGEAAGEPAGATALPPPAPPVELWPLKGPTLREKFAVPPPPKEESLFTRPSPPPASAKPEARRRRPVITVLAVTFLIGLVYLVPAAIMAGKVLPGTSVAGVDLGGLNPREAADRLRERLGGQADADIAVKVGDRRFAVSPAKAGLSFDVEGTVASSRSGFPGPFDLLGSFGEHPTRPRVLVDGAKLAKQIDAIAEATDQEAYQGAIRFKGLDPVVSAPRAGHSLDQDAAAQTIEDAYLGTGAPIHLPTRVDPPKATEADLRKALPDARKAVEKPFTLVNGDRSATLSPDVVAANLTYVPDRTGAIRPVFDAREAVKSVQAALLDPATAPRDASFGIVDGKPTLIPGRTGKGVDTDRLANDIEDAITSGGDRTIQVALTTTRPLLDDQEARSLGIREKLAEYSTTYACCDGAAQNIHAAVELVNGHIVRPGETFSLNQILGRPDEERGFTEGPVVRDGRLVKGLGGGVSQFATALYNAVFYAGLKDVEHTPNAFYVRGLPVGRDATVSYPGTDYRWKNDTSHGVLVQATSTGTKLTVTLWGARRYDAVRAVTSRPRDLTSFGTETDSDPGCLPMAGHKGFTTTVTRVFYRDGSEVGRDPGESVTYAPQPKVTCTGAGASAASEPGSARVADRD
jgi:vancomycin resistance protein YoaR